MADAEYNEKLKQLELLEMRMKLKEGLPHLYGLKMYTWQDEFYTNWEKMILLCASNQSGKSSIQIRKVITLATDRSLWPRLFKHKKDDKNWRPTIWYLYPDQDTAMQEYEEKWLPEFLPRNEYKTHESYGWKPIIKNKVLKGIKFNTGVTVYFKAYSQNVHNLQAGTISYIACDEELPIDLYPELNARLFASEGYFSMAFTATIGQEAWRLAIEPRDDEIRKFPHAKVFQVSMYDCMKYHDGTDTHITEASIQRKIDSCSSDAEVQRRIFGKFVKESGLKYFGFDRARNYVPYPVKDGKTFYGVPKGWRVFSGVDIGSGGENNHPSAFAFVSANSDYTKLRVFRGRRLDGIETTAGDTYSYYKDARAELTCTQQAYDWGCKDFGTLTERAHDPFVKAVKGHDKGEEILNTALKLGILKIYKSQEHDKLVGELESLNSDTAKTSAKDDFIDAVRYAIVSIPVNWAEIFENVRKGEVINVVDKSSERELRPNDYKGTPYNQAREIANDDYEEEFSFYNELY